MKSIPKLVVADNRASLTKFEHAVAIRPGGFYGVKSVCVGNLRSCKGADGRIKGLSSNALNRLREAIARTRHKKAAYSIYGVCFTIPWGKDCELSQKDGSEIWRIFMAHAARSFGRLEIGAIFRVELQQRKAVHWHMIVYMPDDMDFKKASKLLFRQNIPRGCDYICMRRNKKGRAITCTGGNKAHMYAISYIRLLWANACDTYHKKLQVAAQPDTLLPALVAGGRVPGPAPSDVKTWDYCVDCFPLDGVMSAIGYLASHTAKRKQAQLGYTGKQWGYICKDSLVSDPGVSSGDFNVLSLAQRIVFFRIIRSWARRNRPKSVWLKVKPSRFVTRDGVEIFNGLTARNHNRLYLFGVPDVVIDKAIKGALDS